ncbi:N-formylglutamate amidohydrolase [Citreimonas sp.]|uniref:N-formylglutamate amidohydrolase n=1 Tax=Citreimonas sp. TaxID=3036715 RepID=UPI0035C81EBB
MAAFALHRPDRPTSRVVFASPHSGSDYPADLMRGSVLDRHAIRSSEDAFVDRLFDCAPEFGAPLLAAAAPRAYVDLNRAADELDPALIEGIRRGPHNPRVASGLGVIPRVVANGRAIYRGKIPHAEATGRLNSVWVPYHAALQRLLDEAHALHGEAIVVDCHSMPHEAVASLARGGRRAEVVIGDRFGASAGGAIVDRIEAAFAAQGFSVARNAPFAGAYTTQHYGRPGRGRHAVQVEIDRALYMDEATIRPHDGFEPLRAALRGAIAEIASLGRDAVPLAAE